MGNKQISRQRMRALTNLLNRKAKTIWQCHTADGSVEIWYEHNHKRYFVWSSKTLTTLGVVSLITGQQTLPTITN